MRFLATNNLQKNNFIITTPRSKRIITKGINQMVHQRKKEDIEKKSENWSNKVKKNKENKQNRKNSQRLSYTSHMPLNL